MAVVGRGQVPEDAVPITKGEAIRLQWEIIQEWKPRSDVFTLTYGPGLLGVVAGATGFFMNHHYRKKLKLGSFGHFSSYVPLVVMPTLFAAMFHRLVISTSIITQEKECVVCTETKAAALQVGIGLVYPTILAPSACYMLANRYNTVKMPDIVSTGPKNLWAFHMKNSKNLYSKIPYILAIQALFGAAVTYYDFSNYFTINKKIIEIEKKMIAEGIALM